MAITDGRKFFERPFDFQPVNHEAGPAILGERFALREFAIGKLALKRQRPALHIHQIAAAQFAFQLDHCRLVRRRVAHREHGV